MTSVRAAVRIWCPELLPRCLTQAGSHVDPRHKMPHGAFRITVVAVPSPNIGEVGKPYDMPVIFGVPATLPDISLQDVKKY
jgi:hypothetical protein